MEASSKPRRVEIGFAGGLTLTLRLHEDAYKQLREGMGGEGSGRLVEIESEDSRVQIDLAQVVYVRLEIERGKIGFY